MRTIFLGNRWIWIVLIATLAALDWQSLLFASAVAASEKRPAPLSDFDWDKPETARAFRERFQACASEADLGTWLRTNGFNVDPATHKAKLSLKGFPCAEHVTVDWFAREGMLSRSEAVVTEAGCL